MKERPILFSAPMVRAILSGRKTQTRRIIRIDDTPISKADSDACRRQKGIPTNAVNVRIGCGYLKCDAPPGSAMVSALVYCPYGDIGDRLWVKEAHHVGSNGTVTYRADYDANPFSDDECGDDCSMVGEKWRPSIFLRRQHSRITLEILSVRAERLHDITEEDARAEGCDAGIWDRTAGVLAGETDPEDVSTFRDGYGFLWECINGLGSWERNPWVWVIKFRQITKPS